MTEPTDLLNDKRRHDIDALRVLAFGLLILYHVGMFYVADWHWHVKSDYLSEPLQALMRLVNPWRMPLIFLISGVAVHFLLRKHSVRSFLQSRTRRLLIPLLFGMAVIVPPQAYVQAVSNGAFEGNYTSFLWRYFTFQSWPAEAFDGARPYGITWNHLWYLPYLLIYSLALTILLPALRHRWGQRFTRAFHAMRGWQVLVLPALPFALYEWVLGDRFPVTHALFNDWNCHAVSFTAFLLGYLMGSRQTLWIELKHRRWQTLSLALLTYSYTVLLRPEQSPTREWQAVAETLADTFNGWFWLLAILGWAYHGLNRPFAWLRYATEAVFSWYIMHQTITVAAGYYLTRLKLGPVLEPTLVLGLTVLGCLLIHEFIIRRVAFLRPLFAMRSPRALKP